MPANDTAIQEVVSLLANAQSLEAQGDPDQARVLFAKAGEIQQSEIALEDLASGAHKRLGLLYLESKQEDLALKQFADACRRSPNDASAFELWASVLLGGRGHTRETIQAAVAALGSAGSIPAYIAIAEQYEAQANYAAALDWFEAAIKADPRSFSALLGKARALHGSEKREASHAAFIDTARQFPDNPLIAYPWANLLYDFSTSRYKLTAPLAAALNAVSSNVAAELRLALGHLFAARKRNDDAINQFRLALETNETALISWADILGALDPRDAASEHEFEAVAAQHNADMQARAYLAFGNALASTKRPRDAREQYSRALKLSPTLVPALCADGRVCLRQRLFEDAIDRFQKAVGIDATSDEAWAGWTEALAKSVPLRADRREHYKRAVEKLSESLERAERYRALSRQLIGSGRPDVALEYSHLAGQHDPDNPATLSLTGEALLKQGLTDEAIEQFRGALEAAKKAAGPVGRWFSPVTADYARQWGKAVAVKYRTASPARRDFDDQMATLDPSSAAAGYQSLGLFLAARYELEEACRAFQRAVELTPDDPQLYLDWGHALLEFGDPSLAISKYREAAERRPEDVWAYFDWALALERLRRYEDAFQKYGQALEVDPSFVYALHNQAHLLWKQGRYDASRDLWKKAIEAYESAHRSSHPLCHEYGFYGYYADVLRESGELERAEAVLLEALDQYPHDVRVIASLVSVYLEKRDIFERPLSGCVTHTDGLEDTRANACWKAQHYYRLLKLTLATRLAEPGPSKEQLQMLAELHFEMADLSAMDETLKKLEGLDASALYTATLRGRYLLEIQDYKGAIRCFASASGKDPDNLAIQTNLATAMRKASQFETAERILQRIASGNVRHVESHLALADLYVELGESSDPERFEQAIRHLSTAIRLLETGTGSIRGNKKELAAALYLRGYAQVKLHEAPRTRSELSLLQNAERDFHRCYCECDPDHHKAMRAEQALQQRFAPLRRQTSAEWFMLGFSLFLLLFAHIGFLTNGLWIPKLDFLSYTTLTFGALAFMVVSLYLPQILKLKVAGIELEKSSVDATNTGMPIKIRR